MKIFGNLASSDGFSSLDLPKGRKRNLSETTLYAPRRSGQSVMLQASLIALWSQTQAPSLQEDSTQNFNLNPTPTDQQENEGFTSTFAQPDHYNHPYQPNIDYLYPSIVPQTTHTQTDLNYISWDIRQATLRIESRSDRLGMVEEDTRTIKRTVETLQNQIAAQTAMITNI
ncbi:hypothetical protein DFP73DRAFT_592717 [Morchella snyderi]|nr:hypothetical protein DFP73DRAFT_592717 [Morchella snyderi]